MGRIMVDLLPNSNPSRRPKLQVTVYTTPSCPQCEMTKKSLSKGNIRYNVVDLSQDEVAMAMVTNELGYAAAPVVIAGDQHWSGFRHGRLTNLVAQIHGEDAKDRVAAAAA
jgi:glutaredoxin-like protein NrdH